MSPKPVDVRRALKTLRQERPSPEATERARLAFLSTPPLPRGRERRRRLARPLTAAMITAALALVVFTPRTHAGAAWAQTLAATIASPNCHLIARWPDGKTASEEWRSGVKRATVLYNRFGSPTIEMRNDGRRAMNFASSFDYARFKHETIGPNAREWALVGKDRPEGRSWYEIPVGQAKVTLGDPSIKVVGHQDASDGQPETYRLKHTLRLGGKAMRNPTEITAEIDPESSRIRALIEQSHRPGRAVVTYRTEIDYPSTIPASVFAPRPQAAKNVDVYTEENERQVQRGVRLGMGKQGPVTLRAAIVDGGGDLWAFWTGALPDPKLAHPFSAPGVKLGASFTNKIYTTAWKESPKMNGTPADSKSPRIGGMGRSTLSKLGSTVDLDVPYPGGVAHFRKVRYVRVGYIQHVSAILGAKRDYR